ncbi:hypothetical protein BDR07DRAFT_1425078 [Suillus spraguei]|nr:hypothetical protein BDR07DRAFT_1425078 [Suillus spraguei]
MRVFIRPRLKYLIAIRCIISPYAPNPEFSSGKHCTNAHSASIRSLLHFLVYSYLTNVLRPAAHRKTTHKGGCSCCIGRQQKKSVKTVEEHLARGIIVIVNGHSKAISDKEVAHKQAAVNRGNALVKRRPRTSLLFYIVRADFV